MAIKSFRAGRSTFTCGCCARKTRETAEGFTGDFCEQCEELLMLQNSCFDGDYKPGVDAWGDQLRDKWIATIAKRGGNVTKVKVQCRHIFPDAPEHTA
jgi:hypothetical protein